MAIWIDITDLKAWTGHFTGIQRLSYELCIRFARRPDVHFFEYAGSIRGFRECDGEVLFEEIAQSRIATDVPPSRRASKALRDAYDMLPGWLRRRLSPRTTHTVRLTIESALGLHKGARVRVAWGPGDVVLVPGAGWVVPDFMPGLAAAKQTCGFSLVLVVCDLLPVTLPHLFEAAVREYALEYFSRGVRAADAMLAISHATRREMERFCEKHSLACPPIPVIRLGDNPVSTPPVSPDPSLVPGEFLLCAGTIETRKNPFLLYQMVKQARLDGVVLPPIVLAGRPSWVYSEFQFYRRLMEQDPEVQGSFRLLTDVDDAGLAWLYRNCLLTLYPSLQEGWGLPVVEALACGKICLTSSVSSLPEAGGGLAGYASPFDPLGFLALVRKYLDPVQREARESEIRAAYRPQSWDDCYAEVVLALDRYSAGEGSNGSITRPEPSLG